MEVREFAEYHTPTLERDEARHNLILALMGRIAAGANVRTWSLGAPGACAVQSSGFPIVLGDLAQEDCHSLADQTRDVDYPGVVGPDLTAQHFAERAAALGIEFLAPIPQQIHSLSAAPNYPGAAGHARRVVSGDAALFADWIIDFAREAVPHDPAPERTRIESSAAEGVRYFWIVDDTPMSTASIARRTAGTAAISQVYTPPAWRGRGYAGAVTAAVVKHIFAEGKKTACLYTDLRNPFSNRCYAKIGFVPVCSSLHYPRADAGSKARAS
jgi:predicted GNAT family acetyltransferase